MRGELVRFDPALSAPASGSAASVEASEVPPDSTASAAASAGAPGLGPAVACIGVFDGLHEGHRSLLAAARDDAARCGCTPLAVTFERDPDELFAAPDAVFGKLVSNAERLDMLRAALGGPVLVLPATPEVFALAPDAFLDTLASACDLRALHVGADFRFGAHAAGTAEDMRAWAAPREISVEAHALLEADGAPVTATRIRALLRAGEVSCARRLLCGRAHALCGTVVHGRGEGAHMGFATANLELDDDGVVVPAEGVYGGYALVDGKRWPCALNVGRAASFAEATAPLEAHLLGFSGDLYGRRVKVEFVQRLRGQRVFDDTDELVATVQGDIAWVSENLGGC